MAEITEENVKTNSSESILRQFAQACTERGVSSIAISIPLYSSQDVKVLQAEILRRMKVGNEGK
jgi:hypothetical protein